MKPLLPNRASSSFTASSRAVADDAPPRAVVTGFGRHEATLTETHTLATGPGAFDFRVCNVRDVDATTEALIKKALA